MLAAGPLLTVLDSLASEVVVLESAFGIDGTIAGTISGKAASIRDMLSAIDDPDVHVSLSPVVSRRAATLLAGNFYPALNGLGLARALDTMYGGNGSLNRFLSDNDLRVHPNLRKMGIQIDSRNVFRDTALDPVARYEGTGAGSGNFIAGSDIDTREFGEASLEVVVENMGALDRTLRLTLKHDDDTTEQIDVIVPADSLPNDALPVGAAGDRYIGVAGIVTVGAGGSAGDSFRVRSKIERQIA